MNPTDKQKSDGYAICVVEKIETPVCDFCAMECRKRKATHVVKVTHWFRWLGASSRMSACEKHALEIESEFKRQLNK